MRLLSLWCVSLVGFSLVAAPPTPPGVEENSPVFGGEHESRLDWPRFLEILARALPQPGPNGNLDRDPEQIQLWKGVDNAGVQALGWFEMRRRAGVPVELAHEDAQSAHRKNLAMANVEAVESRWVADIDKFLSAADKHVFEAYGQEIAASLKEGEKERDETAGRVKPKAAGGPGWVVEIRGTTDHAAGRQFVQKALVKNLQRFDTFAGEKDPWKGEVSHVFIYNVWAVDAPRPNALQHVNRSYLDRVTAGPGQPPVGAPPGAGVPTIGKEGPIGPDRPGGLPAPGAKEPAAAQRRYEFVVMLVCREPKAGDAERPLLTRERPPLAWPWFDPIADPDTRRQSPLVLPIGDHQADLIRAPMTAYDIITNAEGDPRIAVLAGKTPGGPDAAKLAARAIQARWKSATAAAAADSPRVPPPPGGMGPPRLPPGGMIAPRDGFDLNAPRADTSLEYVPLDELDRAMERGKVPALTLVPLRMLVVHAEVPYRRQVEELRRALRLATPADAAPAAVYDGFEVQRRVTRRLPGGRVDVVQDWDVYRFEGKYQELINARKLADHPDDGVLSHLTRPDMKLALPLPLLVPEFGRYPEVRLRGVLDSLKRLRDANRQPVPVGGPAGVGGPPGPGPAKENQPNRTPPPEVEHLLLRFVDVDVLPGYTYEYRIRLRMENPNFGRVKEVADPTSARERTLLSPWAQLHPFTVPPEALVYAGDVGAYRKRIEDEYKGFADRDIRDRLQVKDTQTVVGLCAWTDQVRAEIGRREPVGAWVVADVPVGRGEYIGRKQYVKLPLWSSAEKAHTLREVTDWFRRPGIPPRPGTTQPKGWVVDFQPAYRGEILVDFTGGQVRTRTGTGRTVTEDVTGELLILRPDGSLVVRNALADEADPVRKQILDAWERWVKTAADRKPPGGGKDDFTRPGF